MRDPATRAAGSSGSRGRVTEDTEFDAEPLPQELPPATPQEENQGEDSVPTCPPSEFPNRSDNASAPAGAEPPVFDDGGEGQREQVK